MNDEQLIWEAYQNKSTENVNTNLWSSYFLHLNTGITLTSLSPEKLDDYFVELWSKMQREIEKQTGDWPDYPSNADETDLDYYFKEYYGFTLKELQSLKNAPQFNEEGAENWPEIILNLAHQIAEYNLNVREDD
jgi:hypothetical protein